MKMVFLEVLTNLFIADSNAVNQTDALRENSITHLLVLCKNEPNHRDGIVVKIYEIQDVENENVIRYFKDATYFISMALDVGGKVVVQCNAGISRSSCFLLAFMMQKYNIPLEEAFHMLRSVHPLACPNAGFTEQLTLYSMMKYTIDNNCVEYRRLLLKLEQANVVGGTVLSPSIPFASLTFNPNQKTLKTVFTCRSCRKILFLQDHLMSHEVSVKGKDASTPSIDQLRNVFRGKHDISQVSQLRCMSHFIEPMDWMRLSDRCELEGKILCPKCSCKLGTFSWIGAQCACGTYISPSFMIHKEKVDKVERIV